jgi:uncharacterized membrane protein YkvA (DUF1232 family)
VQFLIRALRSRNPPWWLWPVAVLLVMFALEPANFGLPALGVLDDLILLPLMLRIVVRVLESRESRLQAAANSQLS